jgi:hypothetical protein
MPDVPAEEPKFVFRPEANEPLTDDDAVMGYDVFLGRNPEDARVIALHRAKGFPRMLATFMVSGEFRNKVIEPLRAGHPVQRGDYRAAPTEDQVEWLLTFIETTREQETALQRAANWSEFFHAFCTIGGLDMGDPPAADAAPAAPPAPRRPEPPSEIARIAEQLRQVRLTLTGLEESLRALLP